MTPKSKQYFRDWAKNNKDKLKAAGKRYYQKHPEKKREWRLRNPDKVKAINKRHNQTAKRKAWTREWQRNRPRSNTSYPLDVRVAMEIARTRDRNTCQWQNCGKTYKETSIHAHHIFPKDEYPELADIPKYIICYCHYHHWLWHEKRNDRCARFVKMWKKKEIVA